MQVGKQSLKLEKPVYIFETSSVVGSKEGEGPLKDYFDCICQDPMMTEKSWELAESQLQKIAIDKLLGKASNKRFECPGKKGDVSRNIIEGIKPEEIRYIFGGDLLGQLIATTFGVMDFEKPFFGMYSACATIGESLSLGAMTVSAGYADSVIALASSHFASAEKNFRTPLEYGNQRHFSATWTVTGSGAFLLNSKYGFAKITAITTGKIVDYGVKDAQNMGACMAPAAADVIATHFQEFNTTPECYDKIITGDLGVVGQKILIDLLKDKGYDISTVHMDCGIEIFDAKSQDTHSGGSGCGCSSVVLAGYLMEQLKNKKYKKILFIPTGALMSPVTVNEKQSIPGIAHLIQIESNGEV